MFVSCLRLPSNIIKLLYTKLQNRSGVCISGLVQSESVWTQVIHNMNLLNTSISTWLFHGFKKKETCIMKIYSCRDMKWLIRWRWRMWRRCLCLESFVIHVIICCFDSLGSVIVIIGDLHPVIFSLLVFCFLFLFFNRKWCHSSWVRMVRISASDLSMNWSRTY